jgi:hypothetical protein
MSDTDTTGFGKFVPGFDFLQNLAKGTPSNMPQMPDMAKWVAPSMNVEDLDKRIEELKNVQFWLEQNSRALGATVQALEVQKMTLVTLKGMNFNIGSMASAFAAKPASPAPAAAKPTPEPEPDLDDELDEEFDEDEQDAPDEPVAPKATPKSKTKPKAAASGMVDPMQLWGSLTQQFQHIAANAMKEVAAKAQAEVAKTAAAKAAPKPSASPTAPKAAVKKPAAKSKAAAKAGTKTAAKPASKPMAKKPTKG